MLNNTFRPVFARYIIDGKSVEIENEKGVVKVSVNGIAVLCAPIDDVRSGEIEWSVVVNAIYGGHSVTTRLWGFVKSEVTKFAHTVRAKKSS